MKKIQSKLQKYYLRLCFEGIVKAVLFGLTVGFGANFVVAAVVWAVGGKSLWLPICVGLGVAAVAGVISFFFRYKPKLRELARRVDGVGLEERAITMLELANDGSCIAGLQRKDAMSFIDNVSARQIKLRMSKIVLILALSFMVLGVSATTMVGLAAADKIPSGTEMIPPEPPVYLEVSYIVYDEEGGEVLGETDQLVLYGEDATPVVAVPFDGYVFTRWTDSSTDPSRHEKNVTVNFELHAFFTPIDGAETEEGDGEPSDQPDEDGDSDENAPNDDQNQDQDGENQDPEDSGDNPGSDESDGAGGGRWDEKNTIIDGSQYYYDNIETYKELAMEFLANNQEIPEYIKQFLETYYDGLS